jgi:hypothetical protein
MIDRLEKPTPLRSICHAPNREICLLFGPALAAQFDPEAVVCGDATETKSALRA